nr:single-stranded DNA-binding protein [Rhodococcus sp. (in: high G+C Gram-positive bacteria)]
MALSIITGTYRLAADPELQYIGQNSVAKARVRLVNDKSKKDDSEQSGWKKVAEHWANGVAWYELAERLNEEARKGDSIQLMAEVSTESWEDKNTGEKKSRDQLNLLSYKLFKKNGNGGSGTSSFKSASSQSKDDFNGASEDPPF